MAQAVSEEDAPRLPFAVVGIGASAGGLEAMIDFLKSSPADSGMAFVLVQHLSPQRESMVAEILSNHTTMRVLQVEDGMPVEPNHVYVIRPGFTMTIKNGRLHLGESLLTPGHRRPVDDFFRSLAEEQRERAVCVIMSGMGSNGTAGAESIKAVGGLCVAQDPESAKFSSMPRHLIDAGLADFILQVHEIPAVLQRFMSHPYARGEHVDELDTSEDRHALAEILTVLRTRIRHDFTGYKKPTVIRRVERRMGLHQVTRMGDYAQILRQNPAEITALADDLMIHVTGFFRDAEVWETLQRKVIEPLLMERDEDSAIRAWVTACSSGEEAYTLAILLAEAAEQLDKRFDIKVFATDTAERSLHLARAGVFPGGIESEVSPERLARYFEKDDACFRVKREVREMVVFAPQNLLQDPPFSRLDLCTCRNLLIYLEPEMQRRVMSLLHFGLRDGGVLVLGSSETAGASEEQFEPIDKRARIYRRVGPTRHGVPEFPLRHQKALLPSERRDVRGGFVSKMSVAQTTNRVLLEQYTPAAVVIDRHGRIIYFHGRTDPFLEQPRGEPTRELLQLARESVRGALRQAMHSVLIDGQAVTVRDGTVETDEGRKRVLVKVAPLYEQSTSPYILVSFLEVPDQLPIEVPAAIPSKSVEVAEELQRVRDELQSAIEELQTSNEEMKASHEEITSINEELQSSNEELETSKEELQSLNEELTTVNAQLEAKMQELERATNDLGSLLSSTDIGVIFLDARFRIRRYTPAVRELIELIPSDIGRPLNDLARKFDDPQLMSDAQEVLERLVPLERQIVSEDGHWYSRRILPYRTQDNRIDGVVVTFVDITALHSAVAARTEAEGHLRVVVEQERAARAEAEAASLAKDTFLANVSHELRTPLSAILLWSKMLLKGGAAQNRMAEGLSAIVKSAEAQRNLVEDLLDTVRIVSGKLRLNPQPIGAADFIQSAIDTVAPIAEGKRIQVDVNLSGDLGVVRADGDRLRQVVWNLLSNAVKFTPAGGKIRLIATRDADVIHIRVIDTGRGIAPDMLKKVFDRFVQSDRPDGVHGGLGLGLSIARQIVDLHGGTVQVKSEGTGRGAEFDVTLPLPLVRNSETQTPLEHHDLVLAGLQLLLVEDDPDTRQALVALVEAAGGEAIAVATAEEAMVQFRRHRPDVIVSDLSLPGMDGNEFIRQVRQIEAKERTRPVPAVACTATLLQADRQRSFEAGFQAHLTKPVDVDQLLRVLQGQVKPRDNSNES